MPRMFATLLALAIATPSLSGCIAIAAAGGGYLLADEIHEKDGKFDPLEDVRGKGDGKN